VNRTFKPKREKIQILITWKLPSRSWQNFYMRYAPRMRLRGWSHSSPKQIQDGGGHYLKFLKNINNFGLDKDICTKFHGKMHHSRPCRDDHVIKSRNRKLIRVTSSNECLKHMCVDLSDYNKYLNQIWYRTQIQHYQHAGMAKFT